MGAGSRFDSRESRIGARAASVPAREKKGNFLKETLQNFPIVDSMQILFKIL